jgi:t-SNARE complex subunit (syntaxin)
MDILAAIKREEKKLGKQLSKLQHRLDGVRSAAKALGHSVEREVVGVKKHVLSAAGRAAISKASKKRWAKVRKQAKKLGA